MYTKEQIIEIVDDLLMRPDLLDDATHNENTHWDAESLVEIAIEQIKKNKE